MTDDAPIPPRLLLIDDDEGQLGELHAEIEKVLAGRPVTIDKWQPAKDENIREKLTEKLTTRPTLVVTDHDLTEGGPAGMLGGSVISWCRAHAIPVGDYSRKLEGELEEPELFDFRFPSDPEEAAVLIVDILTGFDELAKALASRDAATDADSWSLTLATLLGREGVASSFSLYSVRTGASHAGVIERLTNEFDEGEARRLLATYVLGHLLYNGILRYPGPIMGELALCSYLAVADDKAEAVAALFDGCRYSGPFGSGARFFWQEDVDDALIGMAESAGITGGDPDDAAFRRGVVAKHVDPGLHPCDHCGGDRGGFRCPYIDRTVCDLPQCSVPTSSWIPQGAYLTRVDRDYYERWSPLLGL
jgi:hypothetical protein